jgi:hypothetical protein
MDRKLGPRVWLEDHGQGETHGASPLRCEKIMDRKGGPRTRLEDHGQEVEPIVMTSEVSSFLAYKRQNFFARAQVNILLSFTSDNRRSNAQTFQISER